MWQGKLTWKEEVEEEEEKCDASAPVLDALVGLASDTAPTVDGLTRTRRGPIEESNPRPAVAGTKDIPVLFAAFVLCEVLFPPLTSQTALSMDLRNKKMWILGTAGLAIAGLLMFSTSSNSVGLGDPLYVSFTLLVYAHCARA